MPNANLAAATAASVKKRKKQTGKVTGGRNYIPKKVQAGKSATAAAAAAEEMDASATRQRTAENVAAEDGKGKGSASSAASASVEAVVDAVASANGKRGREMYLAGRVADKAPTRDDRKMIADAVQLREA